MSFLGRVQLTLSRLVNRRGLYLGRRSTRVHCAVYRRTGGRLGGRVPSFPKARIALVDHVGARSGTRRTSPLVFLQDGETIAVVASKAGQPTHPAWLHNLKAHPDTTVTIGSETRAARARVASDEERQRLWPQLVSIFPGYEEYAVAAAPRLIPVVLLEPRDGISVSRTSHEPTLGRVLMKTSGVSSGRWTAIVVGAAALLALSLSVGSAAAKPEKCKPKAEAAGCKLPEGARFYKKTTPSSSITVQVEKKGASVDLLGVPIKCKEFAPLLGDESYVQIGLTNTQRPKVGKSYTLKETETQRGEEGEGTSTSTTEVTLNFKTAKQITVKIHQRSETDGKVGCDGGATYTVKRQS